MSTGRDRRRRSRTRATTTREPFPATFAPGLDPGAPGSRRENASNQKSGDPFRFDRNRLCRRLTETARPAIGHRRHRVPASRMYAPTANQKA